MAELDEKKIRSYFLGQLSETESDRLEEEIASDEGLFLKAQAAERELIDDRIRGNLSASDREAFEANYLHSEARREKLTAAASLWSVAGEYRPTEARAEEKPLPFWRTWNSWRIAFAGLAAVLLIGAFVYFAYRSNNPAEVSRQTSPGEPPATIDRQYPLPSEPVNTNITNEANSTDTVPKPTPQRSLSPTATVKPPVTAIATFTLRPGALRDEGERSVTIPPDARTIGLALTPPQGAAKYRTYSAAVRTADGDTVFTANGLRTLRFTLPAAKLENRTYVIFLEGQNAPGSSEPLAEYTFRVRR